MKKEYIAPQLLFETSVQTSLFLMASGEITQSDDAATVTPGEGEYGDSDWASRRRSQWDEEDEDF